jgi:imidazolonepropionase-like amidohydrolase
MTKRILLFCLIAGLCAGLAAAQAKPAKVIAIKNARIIPVVGDDIEGGTIVIRDGKIDAISRDVPVPAEAEIFGVDKTMGSLEKGKAANIVLADDDILEQRTNIKKVYIDGREIDLSNKYTELLEKFKKK